MTDVFVDERGNALRGAVCVGTVHLDTADTARSAALLSAAVMEQLQPSA